MNYKYIGQILLINKVLNNTFNFILSKIDYQEFFYFFFLEIIKKNLKLI